MRLKDYYTTLEIEPGATIADIKKNFRRLALQYHPDTNQGSKFAEAWYREIQEAYEVLKDENRREEYHQQRWLLKTQAGAYAKTVPLTPSFILKHGQVLLSHIKEMDHFRIDHHALQKQVLFVLRDECMDALLSFNDIHANRMLVQTVIELTYPLDYPFLEPIFQRLERLAANDRNAQNLLEQYKQKRNTAFFWEKYRDWVLLLVALVLCGFIYLVGR